MRLRKTLLFLTAVVFIFISVTAMADDIQWLGPDGYLPSAGVDSILFETADVLDDPVADTAGSLVVTALGGGEIVKPLQVPDDLLLSKVHICFAANNTPTGPVTVKLYQGSPDPLAAVTTQVVFQQDIPLSPAILAECNELLVYDPADLTSTPIVPANGPLFLGIGIAGADSPVYLKAVGIEEFSDTFEIEGCDTGVADRLVDTDQGLMTLLSELVADCEDGPPKTHGRYVKCVSHTLNDLKKSGQITGKEKGKIQRCAAKADIPVK